MHSKTVVAFCGRALDADRARRLFGSMDARVAVAAEPLSRILAVGRMPVSMGSMVPDAAAGRVPSPDLVLMDGSSPFALPTSEFERLVMESGSSEFPALMMVVEESALPRFRKPVRVACDFSVASASDDELKLRCHQLLWPGEATGDADFIQVGPMSINLATYQVKVNGSPVDLTFMEYALLSFLVTHPGRIYSREVLLSQVWGFDYYGGSRTVDVHVRRLRAKLGPEAAQHLETVRGAGYLWSN